MHRETHTHMPAVDITSVSITFENGIKREEYGPTRKASVTLTAAVDKGEDGVVALHYMGTLARAKVADLLGLEVPPEGQAVLQLGAAGEPQGQPAGAAASGETRQRRTRAPKADGAAPPAAPTASGQPAASEDWSEGEQKSPATSAGSQAPADDWGDAGGAPPAPAPTPQISDADMAMHCSKHAQRLGGGDKVKAAIGTFKPEGWAQPKFGVTDIPQERRAAFVTALEALS